MSEPVPFVPGNERPTPEEKTVGPAPDLNPEVEAKEKARYREVRTKALEDQHVAELKEKSDNADSDDKTRAAAKAYYKALFGQMRKLDGSLKNRIDRMEAATYRRLDRSGSTPPKN
ncbi:MAG: hypothetical protein M3O82_03030 [Verrucomicrobiota bacterium]|nr:hypothetical protein [Verrucomicrobiota bacterium]